MARSAINLLAAVFVVGCGSGREHVVHVIAERAPGLQKDAPVRYRGVNVGFVQQVYFTDGGVRIDLVVEHDSVPIRQQDTVRIVPIGAFGAQAIDITPGPQTAPLLARGATLPRVEPESTVALPVSMWRALVRMIGFGSDSAALDSLAADSAARKQR